MLGIHVAKHRSFFDGRLNHVGFHTGIVCRTTLKHNGDVRIHGTTGYLRTAGADLFLRTACTDHIHSQLFSLQLTQSADNGGTAETAVEAFSHHQIMLFIVGKGYIRHNRLANTDMELIFRFFLRHCAHIYRNVFEYQRSLALCLRHIVRRLAGNDAGNVLAQRHFLPIPYGQVHCWSPSRPGG